ncbi:hypothetical protein [Streptomyces sp. RerS4]|uniref:hypothetical protein n=1 Tax=Streptomyces sp. RerS4 TaxID=2942449 RepID=UPI00201C46DA|nr:hypothetical protein [Streptomyces sp. RerS4]UQW99586.1 hypothetical protein M4D82_02825 [Streptomyces sp. RerS4]
MNPHEHHLAALVNELPGRRDRDFWQALKAEAGMDHVREPMADAIHAAQRGDFAPLTKLVLAVFDRDDRRQELATVLSAQLGGTVRAESWIADVIRTAGHVTRDDTPDPLEALGRKW